MIKIISIFSFLITLTTLQGEDDLITIKMKNGNEITGKIIQGGPNDYYIRILTVNKELMDIYTKDIKKIHGANKVIEKTRNGVSNKTIPEGRNATLDKPSKKKVKLVGNLSEKYVIPSDRLTKITGLSSMVFGISGAYFHFSSNKNYEQYKNSRSWNDIPKLRNKVVSADQLKKGSIIISSISYIIHMYIKSKQDVTDESNID